MKKLFIASCAILCLAFDASCHAAPAADAQNELELVKLVLLARHGIRSPTKTPQALYEYSAHPWPQWPVAPGVLTAHGAERISAMGGFFRRYYAERGLFSAQACPAPGTILVWSDNADQRTRASGDALLAGMFPGCGLHADYRKPLGDDDVLFHTTQTGYCPLDAEHAEQAVLARIDGNLAGLAAANAATLAKLQRILDYSSPQSCAKPEKTCNLLTQPSRLKASTQGVKLEGPLGIAATVGEIFLLEYAQGMEANQLAWGQVGSDDLRGGLLDLHNLQYAWIEQTPYIAARRGSLLAARILAELQEGTRTETRGRTKKLVAFIGHDTNLANLAGLLGLKLALAEQPDHLAPGETLAFELLQDRTSKQYFVRMRVFAQTLEQLRQSQPHGTANPPAQNELHLPPCATRHASQALCPLDEFAAYIEKSIDKECVAKYRADSAQTIPQADH